MLKPLLACFAVLAALIMIVSVATFGPQSHEEMPLTMIGFLPQDIHFAEGTQFSFACLGNETLQHLDEAQRATLIAALETKYPVVYEAPFERKWLLPVRTIRLVDSTSFPSSVPIVGPSYKGKNAGVEWPAPRFTVLDGGSPGEMVDDLVRDNLTGLIWSRDANLAGPVFQFDHAVQYCRKLKLVGFSDWRLPNVNELRSLLCYEMDSPALPNTSGDGKWTEADPFVGVQNRGYWTSTTDPSSYYEAFALNLRNGWISSMAKKQVFLFAEESAGRYLWPVRGPGSHGCS
jgi:hypothetical protein